MAWMKMRRAANKEPVWINFDLVSHIETEPDKHTYLYFGTDDADASFGSVSVTHTPEEILEALGVKPHDFT